MNTKVLLGHIGLSLLLVIGMTTQAVAEPSSTDSATAQALFDQGKRLMKAHNYPEACPKFEESAHIVGHSGTLLNLADCYEKQGRIATAWSTFLNAAAAANRSGHAGREAEARTRANALAPQVPKVVITVIGGDQISSIEVTRDGAPVGQAQWGEAIPADLGSHIVKASAPGHQAWETTILVQKKGETVRVEVPALEALAEPTQAPTPTPALAPVALVTTGTVVPAAPNERSMWAELGTAKTIALVAGGVGVAGVVVGSVFGLMSKSKHDEAEQHCNGSSCSDPQGVDLRSEARARGNVSTVAFIVGAVGLAGGATLWLTAPRHTETPGPQVGMTSGGIVVKGTF